MGLSIGFIRGARISLEKNYFAYHAVVKPIAFSMIQIKRIGIA
jgi:hypothetical protein